MQDAESATLRVVVFDLWDQRMGCMDVFIVDDHELIREGLKLLLEQETGIEVVGEATSAAEMWSRLDETACNVIILDMHLPDASGFDLLGDLKTKYPHSAVVVLSMLPEGEYAPRATEAGAFAFVSKGTDSNILVETIKRAGTAS